MLFFWIISCCHIVVYLQVVDAADVVLEVLDARDPLGCRCPQVIMSLISQCYLKMVNHEKDSIFICYESGQKEKSPTHLMDALTDEVQKDMYKQILWCKKLMT